MRLSSPPPSSPPLFPFSSLDPIGHVVPEAQSGGPIALVHDGDRIIIDGFKRTIEWDVSPEEEATRKLAWEGTDKMKLKVTRGILKRYATDVQVRFVFIEFEMVWMGLICWLG